jgi:hypothetical protein
VVVGVVVVVVVFSARAKSHTLSHRSALSNLHIILVNQSDGFVETHYPWYDITAKRWMFSSQRVMSNDSGGELAQQNLWYVFVARAW